MLLATSASMAQPSSSQPSHQLPRGPLSREWCRLLRPHVAHVTCELPLTGLAVIDSDLVDNASVHLAWPTSAAWQQAAHSNAVAGVWLPELWCVVWCLFVTAPPQHLPLQLRGVMVNRRDGETA